MTKTIFITYDLGIRGDFDSLYTWLDENNAEERGYGLAVIKKFSVDSSLKKDIDFMRSVRDILAAKMKITSSDRIYMVWNSVENDKIKAGFLFGKSKQAPWTGFAQKGGIGNIDLDI